MAQASASKPAVHGNEVNTVGKETGGCTNHRRQKDSAGNELRVNDVSPSASGANKMVTTDLVVTISDDNAHDTSNIGFVQIGPGHGQCAKLWF